MKQGARLKVVIRVFSRLPVTVQAACRLCVEVKKRGRTLSV